MIIKSKLQDINNRISSLLLQFKYLYVLELNTLPQRINEIIIGENKMISRINKTIYEVTKDDLQYTKTINRRFCYLCINLTSVTVPSNITSIGEEAFYGCTGLTDIYLNSTTPPTLGDTRAIPDTTTIHVPIGSRGAYKSATNWSSFASNIVEDIEI